MKVALAVRPLPATNPAADGGSSFKLMGALAWLGPRYLCHQPIRKPIDRSNFSSNNLLKRRD
jgi:hypothetical protein